MYWKWPVLSMLEVCLAMPAVRVDHLPMPTNITNPLSKLHGHSHDATWHTQSYSSFTNTATHIYSQTWRSKLGEGLYLKGGVFTRTYHTCMYFVLAYLFEQNTMQP